MFVSPWYFSGRICKLLGEKCYGMGMNRDLAHLCCEYKALDADDIADIHSLEVFVGILTEVIAAYIALDVALEILDVAEGSFTHDTLGHNTSCDELPFRHILRNDP